MLRRTLPLIVLLLVLAAASCTSRTGGQDEEQSNTQESADTADGDATPSSEDDGAAHQDLKPANLVAREVTEVDGVVTKTTLDERDDLVGTWSSCELEGELADLGDARRSPLRRMLANEEHVYVIYESNENESWVRAFQIEVDDEGCAAKPWNEFGTNGELDLGTGVADITLFDDMIVTTGIETTRYSLKGEKLGTCDALARFTRVRGRAGQAEGVARRHGQKLFNLRIENGECTLEPFDALEGEETLGMRIAPVQDNAVFAILQVERTPNALAYLKDGATVWRYFPGEEDPKERISIISQLTTFNDDAVVLRSLQKSIDVIDNEGARRTKVNLNDVEAIDTMTFPDNLATLDDKRVLVALRHHKSGVEIEGLSLGLLTFSSAPTP